MRSMPYRMSDADRVNWAVILGILSLLLFYGVCNAQTPPHVRKAFYFKVTPKQGGPSALVGPWNTLAACRDNLGSAMYAHRFACHLTGKPADCNPILGNGYGYLKETPYPPPYPVPDGDCVLEPIVHTGQYGKWVRFWYSADGKPTVVIDGQKPPAGAGAFTNYASKLCPGWPKIYIGDNWNGHGDMVCG